MPHHYKPPVDGYTGAWVGRAWRPGPDGGPCVAAVQPDGVFDIAGRGATMSALLDMPNPAGTWPAAGGHGGR